PGTLSEGRSSLPPESVSRLLRLRLQPYCPCNASRLDMCYHRRHSQLPCCSLPSHSPRCSPPPHSVTASCSHSPPMCPYTYMSAAIWCYNSNLNLFRPAQFPSATCR